MTTESKETIKVKKDGSDAVKLLKEVLICLACINLIVGVVLLIIWILIDGWPCLAIGISCVVSAIPLFLSSWVAQGFAVLVEHAECNQAVLEQQYHFKKHYYKQLRSL